MEILSAIVVARGMFVQGNIFTRILFPFVALSCKVIPKFFDFFRLYNILMCEWWKFNEQELERFIVKVSWIIHEM